MHRRLLELGKRVTRCLAAGLVVAATAGCFGPASIGTMYDNADWLVGKEVDRRLCPNAARRATMERTIDDLLRWHRAKELPRYAALLRRVAAALSDGMTRTEFDQNTRDIERAWQRLRKRMSGPATEVLATATVNELECLERTAEEAQRTALEDTERDPIAYATDRVRTFLGRFESFCGAFTSAQEAAIVAAWNLSPTAAVAEAAHRHIGAGAFLAMMRESVPELRRAQLVAFFEGSKLLYQGTDLERDKALRKAGLDRIWAVVSLLSETQRATLAATATQLADQLELMSRKERS